MTLAMVLSGAEAAPWLDFVTDAESGAGRLLAGAEVVSVRPGWSPESVREFRLAGDRTAALVMWRSHPLRRWTRPELWIREAAGARRAWPKAGEDRSFYLARERVIERDGRILLRIEHALVGENFQAPHLRKREDWSLSAEGGRAEGETYAEVKGSDQHLNLIADHQAAGRTGAARAEADRLLAGTPELAGRVAMQLTSGEGGAARLDGETRRALLAVADRGDGPGSAAAADRLLQGALAGTGDR